jgi:signal transduction histidine kinase
MKLARKLSIALVLGICAVMTLHAYLQLARDTALFEADTATDEHVIARSLRSAAELVWQLEGEARVREMVEGGRQSEREVRIRLVPLDPATGGALPEGLSDAEWTEVRGGRETTLVREDSAGDTRRFTLMPLSIGGAYPAALELSESLAPQRKYIRTSQLEILLAALVAIVLCGLLATGLGFWLVGRPVRELCERARRVGEGDLSDRLHLRQRDEIGQLAGEINLMCDRLEEAHRRVEAEVDARVKTLDQLRHADRLKTVGQLASGVAHELGTPLNVVLGCARLIETEALPGDETARNAQLIAEQTQRMTATIRQLLDFSRRSGPTLEHGSLSQIAVQTAEMLAPLAVKRSVKLTVEPPADGPVPVRVDANQIQQALANLVMNGIQATPAGGEVKIAIRRRRVRPPADHGGPEAEYVSVEVEDEGRGLSPDELPRIFEPFFTTKEIGQGTGLGLSVAYGIVREHGGWIDVASEPGRGSCFAIFLARGQAEGLPA